MDSNTTHENMPLPAAKPTQNVASARRVLGDISPNVKAAIPPTAESPLKRTFATAMEDGRGLMYLKKRRLSGDNTLPEHRVSWERGEVGESQALDNGFRPVFRSAGDDGITQTEIPTIAELSPTEPNTPSEKEESSTQGSSAERKSFSSLINYDQSSQTSIFKSISNAEMLRLQLKVAMYKVRTNQVEVPFVDLANPRFSRAMSAGAATAAAVKEAVEQLREEAREIAARDRRVCDSRLPSTLPDEKDLANRTSATIEAPSLRTDDPASVLETNEWTPRRSEMELHSTPSSYRRSARPTEVELELTSSVVKGRVAEGLLDLRHGV